MEKLIITLIFSLFFATTPVAEEDHDHDHSSHSGHESLEGPMKAEVKKEHDHEHGDHGGHDDHDDHDEEAGHDDHGHGHGHGHGGGKAIGAGKAIVEVDEEKGFKLSPEASKTLKIKLSKVVGSKFKISKSTLVTSKNIKGVYRLREGFFKLLPVKITKEVKGGYMVEVLGVKSTDQIVVSGVGLLRVTDVYSTDKSEYGHAH